MILEFLKVSELSVFPNRLYESSKLKNWMCELSTFLQIQWHIATVSQDVFSNYTECVY